MENRTLEKLLNLAHKRIEYFHTIRNVKNWYRWSQTYFDGILGEMDEVKAEYRNNNHIYLEDELGDVFWNYICFLESLQKEWKISSVEKVFERSYTKLSERIWTQGDWGDSWEEVKSLQKIRLAQEHIHHYKPI